MGRLSNRVNRVEDGAQERARRQVLSRLAGISDRELREVFRPGRPWREIPPEDLGLTHGLVDAAIGSPTDGGEAARRLDRLLEPLWRRLEHLRRRRA